MTCKDIRKTEKDRVIENNPKVDANLVRKHEALETELKKIGVQTKPIYNIKPPLGDGYSFIHNHCVKK